MRRFFLAAALLLTCLGWSQTTLLGLFQNSTDSYGYGLSRDGTVVLGTSVFQAQFGVGSKAFSWSDSTGLVDLHGPMTGIPTSEAYAVGGQRIVGGGGGGPQSAVVFENKEFHRILPSFGSQTYEAYDCSADGSTVVGYQGQNRAILKGFKWTADGGTTTLPSFSPNSPIDRAQAVSADGRLIVGNSVRWLDQNPVDQACWWDDWGIHQIEGLSGQSMASYAVDCTADGGKILCWGYSGMGRTSDCYIYDPSTNVTITLTRSLGVNYTVAQSISQQGEYYCGLLWNGSTWQPFVASTLGCTKDLKNCGLPTGWTATTAQSIERVGQTVVVVGTAVSSDQHYQAYRAILPLSFFLSRSSH